MKKILLLTGFLIFSCENPSTLDSKIQKESPNYTVSCDLVYDYERAKQFKKDVNVFLVNSITSNALINLLGLFKSTFS